MSTFVKGVAQYFQNFLETDFRRRRLPKRNITSTNKDGTKIIINLDKYKSFKRELIAKMEDSNNFDFSFDIKPKKYTTSIQRQTSDFIVKKVTNELAEKREFVKSSFKDRLLGEFINYLEDIEKFYEACTNQVVDVLAEVLFRESTSAISQTLSRINETDSSSSYEVENQLSQILFTDNADQFHEILLNFSVNQKEEVFDSFFEELILEEKIEEVIKNYFESFSITDFYNDLFILEKEIRSKDNLEGYLYIGEIAFNNKAFPIAFIPIEIDANTNNQVTIRFEKRYYINKQAIEYAYQQATSSRNAAGVTSLIPERTIILEEQEDLLTSIDGFLSTIASRGFQIPDTFPQGLSLTSSIGNDLLKIRNTFNVTVADKGDESALNDYEEILGMIDSEDGLFEELEKLINGFISENPENIAASIREEWSDMPTEDRLVFESPIPVNEEQRKIISAVNSSTGKYITVQGPPGTGKSHTISAILFQAIKANQSVLLLSDKKEALDVVEEKLTETLNKVRPDENFQNPILRIGKTGNTYSKILSRQSIESIRVSYESTQQVLQENKDNLKDEIASLKKNVRATIDSYEEIEMEKISEYYSLLSELSIEEHVVDELIESKEDLNYLQSSLTVLNETVNNFSDIDSRFYKAAKKYSKVQLEQIEIMVEVSKLANSKNFNSIKDIISTINLKDFSTVKNAIKEYSLTKSGFWGALFGNYLLSNWQKNLVMELDLFGVFDFRKDIEVLEDYQKILDNIHKIESDYQEEIAELLSGLERENIISKKLFAEIYDAYKSASISSASIMEKDLLSDYIHSDMPQLDISYEEEIAYLEEVNKLLKLTSDLNKNFDNIKDIRFLDNSLDIQQDSAIEMTQEFDKRFLDFSENNAADAKTFKNIITKKQRFPKEDFHKIKNAFPCIISGIRDYAEYIPLAKNVFDLLIIDEASQVSIAQAFPALIRAKKVLVLGDNKQFSNVKSSTASNEINNTFINEIRNNAVKDYGNDPLKLERTKVFNVRTSILDFFEYTSNYSALLKKHFRGYPELISFSSRYFYDGSLQALKVRAKTIEEVLEFKKIEHDGLIETKGNINTLEAKEIRAILEEKLEEENPMSVGVITPFRDQQRFILSEVDNSEKRSEIYSKLKLKVMTFDSCQGEERDHIIYSFVESLNNKAKTSYVLGSKFDNDMDPEQNLRLQRLNVGMSRAKEKMTFLISQEITDFSGNGLMILNHYKEQLALAKELPQSSETESPMEAKLLRWITQTSFYQRHSSKIEIKAQFDVSSYIKTLDPNYKHPNYRCDFLITFRNEDKPKVAIIEYDGFEFHFENLESVNKFNYENYYTERDIERERILESYGFPFIRFNRFNLGKDPVSTISNKLQSFFLPSP